MKKNKKIYNPNMIFGINGSTNLLKAKKLEIISIHIMINGNADRNTLINKLIEKFNNQVQKIQKKD